MTATSIVIPAHNEERVIGRLLSALLQDAAPGELDVVVVANGCRDETASVAAGFAGVRVVETPVASKARALRLGDETATSFPRLYVDADVVVRTQDVRALGTAVGVPGVLAAGPARELPMDGVGWPVRWYYDVWLRLPGVQDELFGRGVIAVSNAGHQRLERLPEVLSDDLAMAMAFEAPERVVVEAARSVIRPPRTYADLLRRRVRAMAGNRQFAELATGKSIAGRQPPRTGFGDLGRIARSSPRFVPKVALFAVTAVLSRLRARSPQMRTAWLRDESSRAA